MPHLLPRLHVPGMSFPQGSAQQGRVPPSPVGFPKATWRMLSGVVATQGDPPSAGHLCDLPLKNTSAEPHPQRPELPEVTAGSRTCGLQSTEDHG